jgi:DeoR family glycerol-3-phosphate regulon repressor
LANICHTRGIEVIEAMPKPSVDIDEGATEPTAESPPIPFRRP